MFRFAILALFISLAVAVEKWVTAAPGDEDSDYFVGYIYFSTGWQGYDCNFGSTFTATTGMGACVAATITSVAIWTTCLNNSVMVRPSSPSSFTCTGQTVEACVVGIIYDNLDESSNVTIISCQRGASEAFTFPLYRATTHSEDNSYSTPGPTSVPAETTDSNRPQSSPTVTVPSTSTSSSGSTNSVTPVSGSSDKSSNNIALGAGIGIGVPAVLISFAAWWFPRHPTKNHAASATTAKEVAKNDGNHMTASSVNNMTHTAEQTTIQNQGNLVTPQESGD